MSKNYRGYIGFSTDQIGYDFKSSLGGIRTLYDTNLDKASQRIVTGGTILTPGDGNRYHVFTGTGQLITSLPISNASVMMVGGGGAGGGRIGGGGGAGGYLLIPGVTLETGSYTATVGAGGAAVTVTYPNGPNPGVRAPNTTFLTYTAYGGGGGSSDNGGSAATGGSGGGGAANAGSAGAQGLNPSTPAPIIASDFPGESHPYAFTQGNSGGPNSTSSGGGGGAGGAGGGNPNGGRGGVGVAAGLTLPPAYGTSGPTPGRWFAGGGGASDYNGSPTLNVGGDGGGGKGSPSATDPGFSGSDNTGGGGGGGGVTSGTSGAGGSGIVVVAYPLA